MLFRSGLFVYQDVKNADIQTRVAKVQVVTVDFSPHETKSIHAVFSTHLKHASIFPIDYGREDRRCNFDHRSRKRLRCLIAPSAWHRYCDFLLFQTWIQSRTYLRQRAVAHAISSNFVLLRQAEKYLRTGLECAQCWCKVPLPGEQSAIRL